jgi:hypothetical protein
MDASFQGSSSWPSASRVRRVERVERVEASTRIQATNPVRHSDRAQGAWPRPDPKSLSQGDIQWFQSLVMDSRGGGGAHRASLPAAQQVLDASRSPLLDSPAERIVDGLAHLRTLRGL